MPELANLDHLSHAEKDALIRALWQRLEAAERRIAELEACLAEPGKTPDNSSLPPSQGQKPNQPEKAKRIGPRLGRLGDHPLHDRPGHRPGDGGGAHSRRDAPRHLARGPRRSALSEPHPSARATRRVSTRARRALVNSTLDVIGACDFATQPGRTRGLDDPAG